MQNALATIGGAPVEHRTDGLSAAFRNLAPDAAEDITRRYAALCGRYGMIASRNSRGLAHESGAMESRHGHIKSRLEQAPLLRGSRTSRASRPAAPSSPRRWPSTTPGTCARSNSSAPRCGPCRPAGRPITPRAPDYTEASALVTTGGGFTFRRVFYTVPSRLVGRRLRLRVHEDRSRPVSAAPTC
jgi:hypothetical protein